MICPPGSIQATSQKLALSTVTQRTTGEKRLAAPAATSIAGFIEGVSTAFCIANVPKLTRMLCALQPMSDTAANMVSVPVFTAPRDTERASFIPGMLVGADGERRNPTPSGVSDTSHKD